METGMIFALIGLFAFGLAYDGLVGWLERQGHHRGIVSLLVVGGVLVTLGVVWAALTGRTMQADLVLAYLLAGFTASGLPMIVGSLWRNAKERQADEAQARAVALEVLGDTKETGRVRVPAGDQPGTDGNEYGA